MLFVRQFPSTRFGLFLLCFIILFGGGPSADEVIEVEPKYEATPQPMGERTWIEVDPEPIFTLEETDDYLFAMPRSPQFDEAGNLYVLDPPNYHAKKFNAAGNFLGTIGNGPGEGPGEVQRLMDMAVTPSGEVWLLDLGHRGLSRFASDGTYAGNSFTVSTAGMPDDVVIMPNGSPVVSVYGGVATLLARYTPQGEHVDSFGHLIEEQESAFLALDGEFEARREHIFFAPSRASKLFRFAPDGTLDYAVETMDDVSYPSVLLSTDEEGNRRVGVNPRERFATRDLSVDDDHIYLYSHAATEEHDETVIDVYDQADGSYVHSFRLPGENGTNITVTEHRIVTAGDRPRPNVQVWKWQYDD